MSSSQRDMKPVGRHIMISYSWGDKQTVLKIYEMLKDAGYKIWIDKEEMKQYNTVLEGMAKAVEDSYAILLCLSNTYIHSANCKTEANYAFFKKKHVVPIKVSTNFQPEGWLKDLIGSKYCIDVTNNRPFEEHMTDILNALPSPPTVTSRGNQNVSKVTRPSTQPHTPVTKVSANKLGQWQKQDIAQWVKEQQLDGKAFKEIASMTGEQLQFVYQVMNKCPDTFYRWAEDKLKLYSIEDQEKFKTALETLADVV